MTLSPFQSPEEKTLRTPIQKHADRSRRASRTFSGQSHLRRPSLIEGLEWRTLFSTWIDTNDINAVRAAYQEDVAINASASIGWTGHIDYHLDAQNKVVIDGGDPGTVSQAYQDAVLHRDNYFRRMAGIPDIAFDP